MLTKTSAVLSLLLGLAFAAIQARADDTWDYAVQVSAVVQASPPRIALSWPQDTYAVPNSYTVYRKAPTDTSWGPGLTLSGATTSYVDASVAVGTAYEYQIVKNAGTYTGYGYLYSGINVPLTETRGKVILIVDNTYASSLANGLAQLQQDLVGDGWTVLRHDVNRTDSVASVKSLIVADYNADPANVKAVFLFGHVPVPYSGNIVPDEHVPNHQGAWPADVYYADMTGRWTDNSVNITSADDPRNWNVPGDGKFDQSSPPNPVQLEVGRVDFANMPGQTAWNGPATLPSEQDLLQRYLNKDHAFRTKAFDLPRRGLVYDQFGVHGGEAFSASAYRNFAPFFTAANVTTLTNAGTWIATLSSNTYLWAYGAGAGAYNGISGIGTNGAYNEGYTTDVISADTKAVFVMLFGSWLGDWDSQDNIMRGILATPSYALTCSWSGRPHWFYQHMGLGETIGYSTRLTQNNTGLYQTQINTAANQIHIALMGDPTLRMHIVAPPTGVTASAGSAGVLVSWNPSPDSVLGYHVYRAPSPAGPFTRLTGSLLTSTGFTDTTTTSATATYLVRAVKLETTPSGSYYNASEGAFSAPGGSSTTPPASVTPPTVSLTAPVNNATVSGPTVAVAATASDALGIVSVQVRLDGANLGAPLTAAPYSLTWDTTTAANGAHSLTAIATDTAGTQATATPVAVVVSNSVSTTGSGSGSAANNAYWVDDTMPAGAIAAADGGDAWTWVSSNPAPYSGTLANQSTLASGLHEHYFYGATATLTVSTGDTLFAYVYLDPANPPSEVMLQWNNGSWEHRAYWGANNITYGANGTAGRYYAGPLPPTGQWVQLTVPASAVGLEGSTLNGMSFSLDDGRATWDAAGKASPVNTPALPTVNLTVASATATIGTTNNAALRFTRTGNTSAALTVNYALGGTAVKWNDYRTPAGDMPVSVIIPAGAASTLLTIVAVTNSTAANPETVTFTLSPDPSYLLGTPTNATLTLMPGTTSYANTSPSGGTTTTSPATTLWVDDALPAGAIPAADGGDAWTWVSTNPVPYSGALANQSALASGLHEHYFYGATATLTVSTGATLFAYVYLDPANPPTEVMLQWNNGSWEHRAFWGANNITYGANGTSGRYYAGPLPPAGQWVQLAVPASAVGLQGSTLNGMSFSLDNGRATWDYAGESDPTLTASSSAASPTTTAATPSKATAVVANNGVPITSASAQGGRVTLVWANTAGTSYRVAYKQNLLDATWTDLRTGITATGPTNSWTDTPASTVTRRFYRVYAGP